MTLLILNSETAGSHGPGNQRWSSWWSAERDLLGSFRI